TVSRQFARTQGIAGGTRGRVGGAAADRPLGRRPSLGPGVKREPRRDVRGGQRAPVAGPRRRPIRFDVSRNQATTADSRSSGAGPDLRPTGAVAASGPPTLGDPGDVTVEPLQLYTPAAAAQLLVVPESWLR